MPRKDPYTAAVRAYIDARDRGRCARCGNVIIGQFSRHHRKPRKMGGANRADSGRLSNVLTLCGSATTPGGCHLWVEEHREEARDTGWLLYDREDPEEVDVVTLDGRLVNYLDDGSVTIRHE